MSHAGDSGNGHDNRALQSEEMSIGSVSHISRPDSYGVYVGENRYVRSVARQKLKQEEAFQRR